MFKHLLKLADSFGFNRLQRNYREGVFKKGSNKPE